MNNQITDWWMFLATIMNSAATCLAVYFTNKWTSKRYEEDKEYRNERDSLVVIKPMLRFYSFPNIVDELIFYGNIRDRCLVLSSPKDGFDFYDEIDRFCNENHAIFRIKNESKKSIHSVEINVRSKLITDTDKEFLDKYSNFIKLLRGNEEIIFRAHNTEQRKIFWEKLSNGQMVKLHFNCTINYLTDAGKQVCYKYEVNISNIPGEKRDGELSNHAKISVIKDEYKVLDEVTLNEDKEASIFRDLQDKITPDRTGYAHKKTVQDFMTIANCFGAKQATQNKETTNSKSLKPIHK